MKIDLIGCLPQSEYKNAPEEQQKGSKLENCPICKKKMWTSEIKRRISKEKNMKLLCWFCLFDTLVAQGIDPRQIDFYDILKTN